VRTSLGLREKSGDIARQIEGVDDDDNIDIVIEMLTQCEESCCGLDICVNFH